MNKKDDLDPARGIINAAMFGLAIYLIVYAVYLLAQL